MLGPRRTVVERAGSLRGEVAGVEAKAAQDRGQALEVARRQRGDAEALGVEHRGGLACRVASRLRDLGQRGAAVLGVRYPADEAVGLELVDDVGHRRAMHLQALADLAQ